MNDEQKAVLESVQEVLRGMVIAITADLPPGYARQVAGRLQGWAQREGLSEPARTMLTDLAEGVERLDD